ncbi:MAG: alpha/beta fold hydrolase [Phycisphaerales bacterium]
MTPILALITILFGGDNASAQQADLVEPAPAAIVVAYQPEEQTEPDTVIEESSQRWIGVVELPGQAIDFAVTLNRAADAYTGTLDIPAQGLSEGELRDIVYEEGELRFTFAIPNLPEFNWPTWVLTLDDSGKAASGELRQSGGTFPSTLTLDESGEADILPRPQNPLRPLPYREVEVEVDAGEHTLAGTLTLPDVDEFGEGPYPGAVLITGSGPQDRDESLVGHKPFYVLSDRLTRRGIAVLRYDDRGFGASTGDFASATTMDFADDAGACAAWLGGREDVGSVGLIGHSEGGLIAPFVARGNDGIDFVVLLAAPGVPGREVMIRQAYDIGAAEGIADDVLSTQSELMDSVYDLVLAEAPEAEVREKLDKLVTLQFGTQPGENRDIVDPAIDQVYAQVTSPWWLQFLTLDPRPALRELDQPVFALNGSLDLQVSPDQNLSEIERVFEEAGKSDQLTAEEVLFVNHLFQPTVTGALSEYASIEITFDEDVMGQIADWIEENAR